MKKFLSILLAGTMTFSLLTSAFAAEPVNTNNGEALNSEEAVAENNTLGYEVISGEIVSVEENGVLINTEAEGNVMLNTEGAILRGTDLSEAKEGDMVSAAVSPIRTRSLPPIANAYLVVVSDITSINYIEVVNLGENEGGIQVSDADGEEIILISDETPVTPLKTKNILTVDDISVGDKVFALSDISTMSIPPQLLATEIIMVEDVNEANAPDTETNNQDETTVVSNYEVISGEIVSVEENGILINTEAEGNVMLNTEDAILRGTDLSEAKEGDMVSAAVSPIRTRSLPPIANAYLVVVSDITSINYIEVVNLGENEGGIQVSDADGEEIILISDETPVTPLKTKNILTVDDISVGDKVFALSDISTMSIPPQLLATEIIMVEDVDDASSNDTVNTASADTFNAEEFLNGREDGLALESNVTRAEALTMVLRADGKEEEALSFDYEAPQYEVISGEIVSVEENGVVINTEAEGNVKLNTEGAIFRGNDINEAKEGNIVSAVVSPVRTRSLPPIANAYLVVVSDTTSINYVEVTKVEKNGSGISIYGTDDTIIISASEETPVTPFKTRNIMSIEDISEGDKIFVLSDIMTASIPARLLANEIIAVENLFDEDEVVYDDTKGHWAENIIGYSIVNGYVAPAEDGSFGPEEEVSGKEFAKIVLTNMGINDVTDENVYELSKENGLLTDESLERAVKDDLNITRLEAAKLCAAVK